MLQDRSIAVWDMTSQTEITLRRVLVGHRAAVNVVDFDEKYIVSASGDRTIKVWNTSTCEFVRTLNGHKRGIACLQYRDRLVVSGSSDNTIRSLTIFWSLNIRNRTNLPLIWMPGYYARGIQGVFSKWLWRVRHFFCEVELTRNKVSLLEVVVISETGCIVTRIVTF